MTIAMRKPESNFSTDEHLLRKADVLSPRTTPFPDNLIQFHLRLPQLRQLLAPRGICTHARVLCTRMYIYFSVDCVRCTATMFTREKDGRRDKGEDEKRKKKNAERQRDERVWGPEPVGRTSGRYARLYSPFTEPLPGDSRLLEANSI